MSEYNNNLVMMCSSGESLCRHERLEEVQRTFTQLYLSQTDSSSSAGTASASASSVTAVASGVLAGLFDNLAGKVGLRTVRNGFS